MYSRDFLKRYFLKGYLDRLITHYTLKYFYIFYDNGVIKA